MYCKLNYSPLLCEAVSIQLGHWDTGHVYVRTYGVSLCVHMDVCALVGLYCVYIQVFMCAHAEDACAHV